VDGREYEFQAAPGVLEECVNVVGKLRRLLRNANGACVREHCVCYTRGCSLLALCMERVCGVV